MCELCEWGHSVALMQSTKRSQGQRISGLVWVKAEAILPQLSTTLWCVSYMGL